MVRKRKRQEVSRAEKDIAQATDAPESSFVRIQAAPEEDLDRELEEQIINLLKTRKIGATC